MPIPVRREPPVSAHEGVSTGTLPGAIAAALASASLDDVSEHELAEAAVYVERCVAEMPDVMRFGVRAVSTGSGAVLLLLGGGRTFGRLTPRQQRAAAARLGRIPLPGIGEFVRLTQGLGLVSVFEGRSEPHAGDGA